MSHLLSNQLIAQIAELVEDEKVRKVLVIGVDGLRGDQIGKTDTPTFDKLIKEGASCMTATNAWTEKKAWNGHSATNWGVLLTGVSPDDSELTANGDGDHLVSDNSISDDSNSNSVFTFMGYLKKHDSKIENAVFNTWSGIGVEQGTILQDSGDSVDYHLNPTGDSASADRDKITIRSAAELLSQQGKHSGSDVDCMFVHVSQCDAAGHASTWDSDEYRIAVSQVDLLTKDLLSAIETRINRRNEEWLIIVTTDHAGPVDSTDHANNEDPQVYTIPMIVWGDGIDHDLIEQSSLYDVAPTVLNWMKVSPPEDVFAGKVIGIKK